MVFIATPFLQSSSNMHQQPPEQQIDKGHGYHPPFEKPVFLDQDTRKRRKLCTPLWKPGSQKSSETTTL